MKLFSSAGAVLLPLASLARATDLRTDDEASVQSVSAQYAYGLMSYYKNNATNLPKEEIGFFPKPHYWWEAGAVWGGMIEYTKFTGDESYVKTVQQALTANYGPNNDILLPWKKDQEGNDDQAFWALALMSALEYQFPEPASAPASYLEVTQNCFNNIVSRWDTSSCGGGLKWQIYPENAYGYNYKNSISNGATFALGARLARYTGNQTYADWASKIYDWTKNVGLIGSKFEVFDGTDDKSNCATVSDKTEWTYNNAMFLHGSAFMYDYTKGDNTWKDRTNGFLERAATFFNNPSGAEDVMFEVCENSAKGCNLDQQSFKAYLARWMAKTAILAPFTKDKVTTYLTKSAAAAAGACTGDNNACGSKWYTGDFDGTTGIGQQLSALEVTQALLMLKQGTVPSTGGDAPNPSSTPESSSTPSASAVSSSYVAPSSALSPTDAPSSADSTLVSSTAESTVAPTASNAGASPSEAASAVPSSAQAPASPSDTTKPGGEFGEQMPTSSGVCTCTPTSTTTVYVPPAPPTSAPAAPPASTPIVPPVVPNTTVPVGPPANTSTVEPFPGAAANMKLAGSSMFAAAALAVLPALL